MNKIRVVIFEDNESLRSSLKLLIENTVGMDCTGAFPDCTMLQQKLEAGRPDVIIMDIDMPGMNGIEATAEVKKMLPSVHVIMQTVFDDEDRIFQAICAGACGYMLKGAPSKKITEAILEVIDGGSPMSPGIARKVMGLVSNTAPKEITSNIHFTTREKDVLRELGNGKSYKMIADALGMAIPTVNTHIRKIYEKLQVNSVQQAVAIAFKKGLI